MIIVSINYERRVYHRTATYGGMDSEPNGSSIEPAILRVVVPSERDIKLALYYCDNHAGNSNDNDYKRFDYSTEQLHAIIQPPLTRL